MRRRKKEKNKKNKNKKKNQKIKQKTRKKHVMLSKKEPKFQELGTVPPIGPLAHQLWFFGKKGAN